MQKNKSYAVLGLACLLTLSACGGGDDAPAPPPVVEVTDTPLNAHYFVGKTSANGSELWKSDGTSDGTALVKDIGSGSSSNPSSFIEFDGAVYFSATDGLNGYELMRASGAVSTIVKNIHPTGDSNPRNMLVFNGKLYFVADDDSSSQGLWESDGTLEGTIKVGSFSTVANLKVMAADNSLYFTTGNGSSLWKFDGVSIPVAPVVAASTFSDATQLTVVGSTLYFVAYNGFGFELWRSDDVDTLMVIDLVAGISNGLNSNSRLYDVGGTLIFSAANNLLYKTAGTDVTTEILVDTAPSNLGVYRDGSNIGVGGGLLYFMRSTDRSIWRTDGTAANTARVSNTFIGTSIQDVQATANGDVYFRVNNRTLWKSDGSLAGTASIASNISRHMVTKDGSGVYYLSNGYNLGYIANGGPYVANNYFSMNNYNQSIYTGDSNVYFRNRDTVHSVEPWVSDGTAVGTTMLADANQLPTQGSDPYDKAVLNGILYFVAASDDEDYRLWKTDGTEAGTVQLGQDLYDIQNLTVSGNKLFFAADHDDYGTELWVTDGTEEGTRLVIDLDPGDNNSNPANLVDANGTLFFVDGDNNMIWKTDGTIEGTLPVSGLIQPDTPLFAAGDKVYFVFDHDTHGEELWVSNGTFIGTKMVKDINPGSSDGVRDYDFTATAIGDILYFAADDGSSGRELWKSDGTEAGTQIVIDLNGNDDGLEYDNNQGPITIDGSVYFMAYNENSDYEIWKSDGTAEGTVQLSSLNEIGGEVDFNNGVAIYNGEAYFSAYNNTDGSELWKTDGTIEGTTMVKNIHPSGSSNPNGFGIHNNILFFIANDGTHGQELWKTDGTEEGTVMVKDIAEGTTDGAEELEEGNYSEYWY